MEGMNNVEGMAMGLVAFICLASVVVNVGILTVVVKLYTEFAKERFKGKSQN